MVRSMLDPSSPEALVAYTPSNGLVLESRTTQGAAATQLISGPGLVSPGTLWLKLDVNGSNVASWYSSDGQNWTFWKAQTIPLGTTYYVGLAVSAGVSNPDYISDIGTTIEATFAHGGPVIATFDNVSLTAPGLLSFPSPWAEADLGAPPALGTGLYLQPLYSAPLFSVFGSGSQVRGEIDQGHLVYQGLSGDGQIVAHLVSQQQTSPWAKAAVMFRSGTNGGSMMASLGITPGEGVLFQTRSTSNGNSVSSTSPIDSTWPWLKLERRGPLIFASQSEDGLYWNVVGVNNINLGASIDVGLNVSSFSGNISMANLDNVAVTPFPTGNPPGSPWVDTDIGAPALPGGSQASDGDILVAGAGADIGGTADSFHFLYQPFNGDGEIISAVSDPIAANLLSKAGVMIRETLDPAARSAIMALTSKSGVLFRSRSQPGATSPTSTPNTLTGPGWVKLQRVGNTLSGYWMTGQSGAWQEIGSATVPMAATTFAGLAVTSQNVSLLSAATFTNPYLGLLLNGDNGTLPDWWQIEYFNAIVDPGTMTSTGLTALQDYQFGIDPSSGVTDSNGLPYVWEVTYFNQVHIHPNGDANGDGITNFDSYILGINPIAPPAGNVDSDGDGVPDNQDAYPNDPTRWLNLPSDPNDHTAPVITLTTPSDAILVP
jgi:regulation of enolase protein 1 (concanavalin A-like superfamily)